MPKNIVVFADGTGQEGGKGWNTNVYKLFNAIEDRTPDQISYYDAGLGTGLRKLTGNVGGMGISKNILDLYEFIFEHYEAGDKIFMFGFSRGAATVRSLSSFIHTFGILPKSRSDLIPKAYKIYKTGDVKKRDRRAKEFVDKHHTMWTKIHFLGVWDTVTALGIPSETLDAWLDKIPFFRHRFQDFTLSESVVNARQAFAIDDRRLTFHPTPFRTDIDPGKQTLKQVWFCGMHTDVGGGYEEPELSNIALEWMVVNATAFGLKIYSAKRIGAGNPDGMMHDSREGTFKKLFREAERTWDSSTYGIPVVHNSVIQRKNNPVNDYDPWILKALDQQGLRRLPGKEGVEYTVEP